MWSVTRKLMRSSLRRLIPSIIAIWIAAAFVSGAFLFSNSLSQVITDRQSTDLAQADYVIVAQGIQTDESTFPLSQIKQVQGVKDAYIPDPIPINLEFNHHVRLASALKFTANRDLLAVSLSKGDLPNGDGQIAIDDSYAKREHIQLGDTLAVSLGKHYNDLAASGSKVKLPPPTMAKIVGFVHDDSASAITYVVPSNDIYSRYREIIYRHDSPAVEQVLLETTGELSSTERSDIQKLLPRDYVLKSRKDIQTERSKQLTRRNVTPQNIIVLVFGLLAMFVASLVVSNTFQVLVAQRKHILALLRIVGAKKKQLYHSVLVEALVISLFASIGGILTAIGLMYLVAIWDPFKEYSIHIKVVAITSQSVLVPLILMVLVTVLACLAPAIAATRVKPLEALRVQDVTEGKRIGMMRVILTLLFLAIGGYLIYSSVIDTHALSQLGSDHSSPTSLVGNIVKAMAGSSLVGIGLLIGARIWLAWIIRVIGQFFIKFGPSARIAQMNVRRNPARIAATGSALLIGVTLVSCVATTALIAKSSLKDLLDSHFAADVIVSGKSVDESTLKHYTSQYHPEHVLYAPIYETSYVAQNGYWQPVTLIGVKDTQELQQNVRGDFKHVHLEDGQVLLSQQWFGDHKIPSCALTISTTGARSNKDISTPAHVAKNNRVFPCDTSMAHTGKLNAQVSTYGSIVNSGMSAFVTARTLQQLGVQPSGHIIILLVSDAQIHDAKNLLTSGSFLEEHEGQSVSSPVFIRAIWNAVIDLLFIFIAGMLSISIIISLIGLMNTLILSILERRREIATLRAIGLRRNQVRRSLTIEAMMIAVTTSLISMVIGTLFGFLGAYVTLGPIIHTSFRVDWITYVIIFVISIVVSIVASVLPAHNAAKVPPIQALQEE